MFSTQRVSLLAVAAALVLAGAVQAQALERISVTATGGEPNQDCIAPSVSGDGSVVVFLSAASNLVPGDTNGLMDVFVRDRTAQTTIRVNVGNAGQQSTYASASSAHVSADGRFVLFDASGLDPLDTDPEADVYVHDRASGVTTLLSVSTQFTHHNSIGLSANGRTATFVSHPGQPFLITSLDLVTGARTTTNPPSTPPGATQVYFQGGCVSGDGRYYDFGRIVHFANDYTSGIERLDLSTGALTRLLDNTYFEAPVQTSLDGRYVLYTNYGAPIVSGFTSLHRLDTFTGQTVRIDQSTIPPTWGSGNSGVLSASMSSSGAYVAFTSDDAGIVPPDLDNELNAFVRVPAQHGTLRVDYAPQGAATDGSAEEVSLSATGQWVAFTSWYDQYVTGDTNQRRDVFVRAACGPHHADLDHDGHGASGSASVAQCLPAPPGWSVSAGDCDDTRANVHPLAFDGCDALDNDCDGAVDEASLGVNYCAPSSNSGLSCQTAIGASGCLALPAGGGFVVTATNLDPQRSGLLFYGLSGNTQIPWGAGGASFVCVDAPRQRTGTTTTGGAAPCSGALSLDLAAWLAANPAALGAPFSGGEVLYLQGWYRDPGAPLHTSLTSALSVAVTP